MRVLIAQPIHESGTAQLEAELAAHPSVDLVLFPEGYLANDDAVRKACDIARLHQVILVTGYLDSQGKDRAIMIGSEGELLLDRAKTPAAEALYKPSSLEYKGGRLGYLFCVELLKGLQAGPIFCRDLDLITHPIGVGMFSDEQFEEWIAEAGKVALKYNTTMIGASHADGSFRNCGVSIPIAYCIDKRGEAVFISKDDVRTRIVDLSTGSIEVV